MTNVMISEQEIWKDIPGYKGLYQASSLGNIRSLVKGKVLKAWVTNRGYLQIELNSNGTAKNFSVHSLILTTFKGPRPKDNVVMHLNDITTDNRLLNLKWGTQKENINDSHSKGRNVLPSNTRPVEAMCLRTGNKLVFGSRAEAVRKLGTKNIDKVLSGERPHCKNYHFTYKN